MHLSWSVFSRKSRTLFAAAQCNMTASESAFATYIPRLGHVWYLTTRHTFLERKQCSETCVKSDM